MTDREMIFHAARAAGVVHPEVLRMHLASGWNPLTDDGDAFRLAVMLDLNVQVGVVRTPDGFTAIEYSDTGDRDDCELTRRAIFRAAAEIGRNMK